MSLSKGVEGSKGDTLSSPKGSWVVLELFGHKIIAGLMFKEESLGIPLIRLDVPGTSLYPAFTRHYHPNAVFSITYVNAGVVNSISQSVQDNPVVAYAPDLTEISRLKDENQRLKQQLDNLHSAIITVSSSGAFSPDVPF